MTSTALDAIIAILVIGTAITTLVATPTPVPGAPAAESTLETLATGTTAVNYTHSPEISADSTVPFEDTDGSECSRTASGSYVELLTRATVSTFAVEGRPVTAVGEGFRDAVDTVTISIIPPRTQVAVLWRPYPNAHLEATLTVGPTPPPEADLSAASTAVSSGIPPARREARAAARTEGYAGVSHVLADRIVTGVFPPERTSMALRGGYPVAPLVAHRYDRFGDRYDVDLKEPISKRRPADANDQLSAAVADRIETDLRAQFDTPAAAARAVRVDRVELVVRRWG